MTDYTDPIFDDEELLLASLIADVEADKSREREEYEQMKHAFVMGEWRKWGYNKTEMVRKLDDLNGKIMGFEKALRTLYIADGQRKKRYEKREL